MCDVSFVLHFSGYSGASFKPVLISFKLEKSNNLLGVIAGQQQSDWSYSNLISVQHYRDMIPDWTAYEPLYWRQITS